MTFRQKLEKAIKKNNSLLCVGLDNGDFKFDKKIIDQTSDLVCAYKPNFGFYGSSGKKGIGELIKTIRYIHKNTDVPVILDAKLADIGNTSHEYAKEVFEILDSDAVTVNPYLGFDSLEPFLKHKDRGIIVLARTSNLGASDFQDLLINKQPLYVHVAKKVLVWNKKYGNCLMVVGATWPEQLKQIRKLAPKMTFLVPGIGAQGGDLKKTLEAGLTKERSGLIINSSRGIIFAENPRQATLELRDSINKYRWQKGNGISEKVAKILLEIKAITLNPTKPYRYASGILSPVYTDCRILMAYPKYRKLIRDLYVKNLSSNGKVNLIAATATAGIPHGAWISDKMNLPMVYVRGSAKDHGKGNQIEGIVKKGQKAAVIEDLISTGASSTTTADAVRKAGGNVSHIFSIFTYGMKIANESFKKNNLELTTLTDFETVVEVAEEIGYINNRDKDVILKWTEDPASWGKKMGFE